MLNTVSILAGLLMATTSPNPEMIATLHDTAWTALLQGEVLVEKIRDEDGMPGIRALFTVHADRDQLWGMLTDYENFSEIYNGIDSVEVLEQFTGGAIVRIYQDIRIRKIRFILERRYENPGHRLSWDRVSGDLKIVKGSWDIIDSPDENIKLVVYTSYFRYGNIIPPRLTRNWAMNEVENMVAGAREWILENGKKYGQ
jgi:hypothetical protein